MKRKRFHVAFGVIIAGLLLLSACSNPLGTKGREGSAEEGAVVLVFNDLRAQTILPEISLDIARYDVSFTRKGFDPVLLSNLAGSTTRTEPVYLRPGVWTVTATAANASGDIIGAGSGEVEVIAGHTSSIFLPIRSLSGDGSLSLSANLSELALSSPTASGSLTPGGTGEVIPISLDITGSSGSYAGSIPAGTYLLALELADGATSLAMYVDTVLIVAGYPTTGSFAFKPKNGSVIVELLDQITRAIAIELSGLRASLSTAESMTVTASPAVAVDSYQWYLDGVKLIGETNSHITLGPGLEAADYTLTVVVKKGEVYSSQSGEFTVTPGAAIVEVVAGFQNTFLIKSDGTVWATGSNGSGQLGTGDTTSRLSFVQVATGVAADSSEGSHTMLLKSGGTLWAAGWNLYGQLGTGDTTDRSSFTQIGTGVMAIAAGAWHSMALKSDSTLWATGDNRYGQLGTGDTTSHLTFVQVASGIAAVEAGAYHTVLLKPDGTLWATGCNFGQLGTGDATDRLSFVQVASGVTSVSAGYLHTMLLDSDGTVWATGHNAEGQLGTGDTTGRLSFVQVATGVTAVSAGGWHTMLLKSDGTLWATGRNFEGQLGTGDTTERSSFVQVASGVAAVSAGYNHTMFLKSDGSLWATGYNIYGALGTGDTTGLLSFTQVSP